MAKSAFAVFVFATTVAGWAFFKPIVVNHLPLPDSVADADANRCALWFVGSSTIERWQTMQRDITGWQTHNRGIGGAKIDQVEARSLRTDAAIPPAGIVIYAGENDINAGATGRAAAAAMIRTIDGLSAKWPDTPLFVIELKPSPRRWSQRPEQLRFNEIVRRHAAHRAGFTFLAAGAPLMRGDIPDPTLFADGVHLSEHGYALWSRDVRAGIDRGMPADRRAECLGKPAPARTSQS